MAKVGYARCSKGEQDTALQVAALKAAGCETIYEETASGGTWVRPVLHQAMAALQPGDVLVVWKLDRLSRSVKDLLLLIEKVSLAGARFQSLTEEIDTTTAVGRVVLTILSAFAEFERAMLRERTLAGLRHAREQGRLGGRRYKLHSNQRAEIIRMVQSGEHTAAYCARLFEVHPSTISYLLDQARASGTKALR